MSCNPIVVAGLEVPCDSPVFLTVLAVHIPFGLACVVTGIVAMLSTKGRGLHPTFGTMYYGSLVVVFASATALAAMRVLIRNALMTKPSLGNPSGISV